MKYLMTEKARTSIQKTEAYDDNKKRPFLGPLNFLENILKLVPKRTFIVDQIIFVCVSFL